ncbi:uncharacterized protein LOC117780675 [Drosophila innubila]|uniref:uncharacterized protein LOC117780675 n=1 Tax=Drosophila innubila TaxID=198719 RepID=UPI00148E659B|nr:uncharacterized protein LOC117780675 [Drosophila innubila]
MKKVLLTKSQQIRVTTSDIKMKPQIGVQTNVITNTYMQRKSFQSIYEDIFKLLMRLPDKALQQRVIDAINGRSSDKSVISNPNQCKHCSKNEEKPLKVNASTQTQSEILETKETQSKSPIKNETNIKVSVKPESPLKKVVESTVNDKPPDPNVKVPRKRGRKRNTCVPQVVKRSAAQMAWQEREDKQLTPLQPIKKKKLETPEPSPSPKATSSSPNTNSLQRRDSVASNFSACLSDINLNEYCDQIDDYINDGIQRTILTTMSNEFLISHVMSEEGLLPIHDAILRSNIQGLQRQVFVWSKMKENVDFNELLSADGEDCLQLAITTDCHPEIVKIILNAGVLPMHIYEDSNTALHLAIINNIKLESLRQLMLHIDLNLLLQTNDDGYTALHIAVRHNRYKMAEIICNIIDERQLGAPVYQREESDGGKTEESSRSLELRDEKSFAKFYERACDRLHHNKEKLMGRRLKNEILNASEARAGNASLYFAVEGEMEHLCYFLLAHLSDPDEENLSGHSPKSYHYEFARLLRISLKIARIMDKVISILNGKSI